MADNNNDIDILLRYLAKRASPDSKEPRINFKKFADAAQTREQADFKSIEEGGERLFGPRASAKRKHYRELYNNYVKKVDYGTDILDVPSDWSIDLYLEITPELRRWLPNLAALLAAEPAKNFCVNSMYNSTFVRLGFDFGGYNIRV